MDDRVIIEQLDTQAEPGSAGWSDFVAANDLMNDTYFELEGDPGLSKTPEQRRIMWRPRPEQETSVWAAKLDDGVVGFAFHRRPTHDGARESWTLVGVDPDARGQGVGSALLRRVVAEARAAGSTTVQSFVAVRLSGDEELFPVEDGSGGVPVDALSTHFARSHGFRLVQAMAGSAVDVPVPAERLAEVEAGVRASSTDYVVRTWDLPTPDDLADDLAVLRTRMSTDAPAGGTATSEDPWDAARVVEEESALARMGRRRIHAGAVHRASGRLVAFTEIDLPSTDGAPADQQYTLVLREHRGHGLGMLVKGANLRRLAEVAPEVTRVVTFNADENEHMRRINHTLGFHLYAVSGGWRLDL